MACGPCQRRKAALRKATLAKKEPSPKPQVVNHTAGVQQSSNFTFG